MMNLIEFLASLILIWFGNRWVCQICKQMQFATQMDFLARTIPPAMQYVPKEIVQGLILAFLEDEEEKEKEEDKPTTPTPTPEAATTTQTNEEENEESNEETTTTEETSEQPEAAAQEPERPEATF